MIARRIGQVWRERGLLGLIRFALGRLLVRPFHRVLYELQPSTTPTENPVTSGVRVFDARTGIPPDVEAFVGQQSEEYLRGVRGGEDLLYIAELEGRPVHYGFVMMRTRETAVLNEPFQTPLIGNCWTDPRVRGRGVYPSALRAVAGVLRDRGVRRILIETDVDNTASRRGIEKAGFTQVRFYSAVVLFNSFVVGSTQSTDGRRLKRIWRIRPLPAAPLNALGAASQKDDG